MRTPSRFHPGGIGTPPPGKMAERIVASNFQIIVVNKPGVVWGCYFTNITEFEDGRHPYSLNGSDLFLLLVRRLVGKIVYITNDLDLCTMTSAPRPGWLDHIHAMLPWHMSEKPPWPCGSMSIVLQPTGPTAHWSYIPLVLQPTGPTIRHLQYSVLFQYYLNMKMYLIHMKLIKLEIQGRYYKVNQSGKLGYFIIIWMYIIPSVLFHFLPYWSTENHKYPCTVSLTSI